jgi:hypothetical protein
MSDASSDMSNGDESAEALDNSRIAQQQRLLTSVRIDDILCEQVLRVEERSAEGDAIA